MVALLAGCVDEDARQQSISNEAFGKVLALINEAEKGFVPHEAVPAAAGEARNFDVQAFRKAKFSAAADALKPLLNSGSDAQRTEANRLLGTIEASASRHASRDALANWAEITRRSTMLISLMGEVDRAAARVEMFNPDVQTPLVSSLKERRTSLGRTLSDYEITAAALQPKIKELTQQRDKFIAQGDASAAEAGKLRDRAFAAEGREQLDIYAKADLADRAGQKATAAGRDVAATLDVYASELKIIDSQVVIAKESLAWLEQQIADIDKAQAATRKSRDTAKTEQENAISELVKQLESLNKDFATTVEAGFVSAVASADKAVDYRNTVATRLSNTPKRLAQFDLLSAQVMRIDTLVQHQYAIDTFRRTLEMLASQTDRLMPGRTIFAETAAGLRERQEALAATISTCVKESTGLAAELAAVNVEDDAETPDFNEKTAIQTLQARIEFYSTKAMEL